MSEHTVKFCIQCGTAVSREEYAGKIRPRCPSCGWVYFPDPKVAVAVVVERDHRLLFVQRAVNPFRGLWSLPAGFLDAGEDPRDAAVREVKEETDLDVEILELIGLLNVQEYEKGAHLLIIYRAGITGGRLSAGDDAAQAKFFKPGSFPPFAFQSTTRVLEKAGY